MYFNPKNVFSENYGFNHVLTTKMTDLEHVVLEFTLT